MHWQGLTLRSYCIPSHSVWSNLQGDDVDDTIVDHSHIRQMEATENWNGPQFNKSEETQNLIALSS